MDYILLFFSVPSQLASNMKFRHSGPQNHSEICLFARRVAAISDSDHIALEPNMWGPPPWHGVRGEWGRPRGDRPLSTFWCQHTGLQREGFCNCMRSAPTATANKKPADASSRPLSSMRDLQIRMLVNYFCMFLHDQQTSNVSCYVIYTTREKATNK